MNMGEILKFCKDHKIYPDLLTQAELTSLVRLLNLKRKKTEDVTTLDQDTFSNGFFL